MTAARYRFHAACLLFPELGKEELKELAEDIKARGLLHDIVTYKGQILDGRNRLAACKIAKVKPRFKEWKGAGSPVEWVISENLIRRHLTSSQRAVVALDLLPLLEEEAKQRQRLGQGRGIKVANSSATVSGQGKASQLAARLTKTNSTYVERVKAVSKRAPELVAAIRSGQLNVPDAQRLARMPESERTKVLRLANGSPMTAKALRSLTTDVRNQSRNRLARAYAKNVKPGRDQGIITGDMQVLWKRLEDNSVDLFLSDPVYQDTELYDRFAELAAAKLKPGGLCLAYTGQVYLPANLAAMSKHLEYWWLLAVQFGGQQTAIHGRHIQNCWKPILAFAKPPVGPAPAWLRDSLSGSGRDKEFHVWGKDESEARYLIQQLTEPGALVVDCFCGGGVVPAACKALGRRWLATETDATTAGVARRRLVKMDLA